jgi:hypothetical protein
MDDQRTQPWSERRTRLQPRRWRGGNTLAATGANAVMTVDASNDRADRSQLDVIVGMDVGQIGGCEGVGAVRAGGQPRLDGAI